MTYIVKTMSDGKHGVYDTVKACFPLQGDELRAAGIKRVNGSDGTGWYAKNQKADAEQIALLLNEFHGHIETATAGFKAVGKDAEDAEDALRKVGEALIEDEKAARA